MIDNRTPNLDLPLPNINNLMKSEDVPRLRDALALLDQAVADRATIVQVTAVIEAVVGAAPGALDTLQELAAAINDDADFAGAITAALATKLSELPVATSVTLGGFKVGAGLVIGVDGTLSTTGAGSGSGLPAFAELTMIPVSNGQTTFTPAGGYIPGEIELYLNGVLLYGSGDDYTASDGTTIVLGTGVNTVDRLLLRKWYYLPLELAVNRTGDTMSGHLNVPPNATGTQVPQAQEVLAKTGGALTGAVTVPAGATGAQVPQAQEVVLKSGATMTGALSVPAGATGAQVPRASEVVLKSGGTLTGQLTLAADPVGDLDAATKQYVRANSSLAIGDVLTTARPLSAPDWLLCDGGEYLQASYPDLFGVLGVLFDFPKLANPATLPASAGFSAAFSADGVYMAVAHQTSPYITVYKRSGDVFTKLADPATLPAGAALGVAFSADGVYMAVAHQASPYITVYKRSGDVFTKLADPATLPAGNAQGVAFSADGVYMAVAHQTSPIITIYKRSGDVFTKLANPATLPAGTAQGVAFSADGVYMAVAHQTSPYITVYKRSGDVFTKQPNSVTLPAGNAHGAAFSVDGMYMAVAHDASPYITIYGSTYDRTTGFVVPNVSSVHGLLDYIKT